MIITRVDIYNSADDTYLSLGDEANGKTITSIEQQSNGAILFYHGVDVIFKLCGGSYGIYYEEDTK